MAAHNVFVSYSRVDSQFVLKLCTELRRDGANLWLDQLDIATGATWDIEIEKALEACDCLLFIVSKASASSNNVLNEVYYALEEKKRVLPVKIDDCKIPFRISRLQYIDLSINYDNGFENILKALDINSKPESMASNSEKEVELMNQPIEESKLKNDISQNEKENRTLQKPQLTNPIPAHGLATSNLETHAKNEFEIKFNRRKLILASGFIAIVIIILIIISLSPKRNRSDDPISGSEAQTDSSATTLPDPSSTTSDSTATITAIDTTK